MRNLSFKDSIKALEAHIQYANTLALGHPREKDGARLQMRLSYSPAAPLFLSVVQRIDFQVARALGLIRVLIDMTYADGKTTMSVFVRKATIRDFYAVILPSLLQLQRGISDLELKKQKEDCVIRYKRKDDFERGKLSEKDLEREEECGICLDMNSMVVLPGCGHSLCLKCYHNWHGRSRSCPFCRDSLKRVGLDDLWIYLGKGDIVDLSLILKENCQSLFMFIDKLPLEVPERPFLLPYDSYVR